MMRRWGAVQCSQGGVGGGGGPLQRLRRRRQLRTLDARLVEVGGVRAAGAVAAEDGVLAGVVAVVLFVCLLLFGRIGQLIVRQAADGQTRCVRCAAAPPCPPPPRRAPHARAPAVAEVEAADERDDVAPRPHVGVRARRRVGRRWRVGDDRLLVVRVRVAREALRLVWAGAAGNSRGSESQKGGGMAAYKTRQQRTTARAQHTQKQHTQHTQAQHTTHMPHTPRTPAPCCPPTRPAAGTART